MKIRFIRSVLHRGQHMERGTVADLPEKEALIFLRGGDASTESAPEPPAKPAPAPVETAEAKGPAREKAVKK